MAVAPDSSTAFGFQYSSLDKALARISNCAFVGFRPLGNVGLIRSHGVFTEGDFTNQSHKDHRISRADAVQLFGHPIDCLIAHTSPISGRHWRVWC